MIQKQPFAHILQDRCSKKLCKIHRKTPLLESLFKEVAGLKAWNFIKKRLQYTVFLTHVGIQQILTWKAKSLYHVGFFFSTWFFSATSKVQNHQNKTGEKSLYSSKYMLTTCFKNFKNIFEFMYILYSYWERAIVFINCCCLPCFFSIY